MVEEVGLAEVCLPDSETELVSGLTDAVRSPPSTDTDAEAGTTVVEAGLMLLLRQVRALRRPGPPLLGGSATAMLKIAEKYAVESIIVVEKRMGKNKEK